MHRFSLGGDWPQNRQSLITMDSAPYRMAGDRPPSYKLLLWLRQVGESKRENHFAISVCPDICSGIILAASINPSRHMTAAKGRIYLMTAGRNTLVTARSPLQTGI
jgi:hypothetical protein